LSHDVRAKKGTKRDRHVLSVMGATGG
jgi:hypothetical protein